jgi:hypothetical protein
MKWVIFCRIWPNELLRPCNVVQTNVNLPQKAFRALSYWSGIGQLEAAHKVDSEKCTHNQSWDLMKG